MCNIATMCDVPSIDNIARQEDIFSPDQRKKRIVFWTWWCTLFLVLSFLLAVIEAAITLLTYRFDLLVDYSVDAVYCSFFAVCGLIWICLGVGYFFWVRRLWEEIPKNFARTTPSRAAWFLFIPVFNFYWTFVVFLGLYRGMNAMLSAKGLAISFCRGFVLLACMSWLIYSPLVFLHERIQDRIDQIAYFYLGDMFLYWQYYVTVVAFVWVVLTITVFWAVSSSIMRFIDLKSRLEASDTLPEVCPQNIVASVWARFISVFSICFFSCSLVLLLFLCPSVIKTIRDYNAWCYAEEDKNLTEHLSERQGNFSAWAVAANIGVLEGQVLLGHCYHAGIVSLQDHEKAVKWWRKAALRGNMYAQVSLGIYYYYGEDVPPDYAESVRWLRKSAEQGHQVAQYLLSLCYLYGAPSDVEAMRWLHKAAEQGYQDAIILLEDVTQRQEP